MLWFASASLAAGLSRQTLCAERLRSLALVLLTWSSFSFGNAKISWPHCLPAIITPTEMISGTLSHEVHMQFYTDVQFLLTLFDAKSCTVNNVMLE